MKKYKYEITYTDVYKYEITARNAEEAEKLLGECERYEVPAGVEVSMKNYDHDINLISVEEIEPDEDDDDSGEPADEHNPERGEGLEGNGDDVIKD